MSCHLLLLIWRKYFPQSLLREVESSKKSMEDELQRLNQVSEEISGVLGVGLG